MAIRPAAAAAAAADGMARGASAPCTLGTERPGEGRAAGRSATAPRVHRQEANTGPACPHAKESRRRCPQPLGPVPAGQLAGFSFLCPRHRLHRVWTRLHAPNSTTAPLCGHRIEPGRAVAERACRRPSPCRRPAGGPRRPEPVLSAGRPPGGTLTGAHAALLTGPLKRIYEGHSPPTTVRARPRPEVL